MIGLSVCYQELLKKVNKRHENVTRGEPMMQNAKNWTFCTIFTEICIK